MKRFDFFFRQRVTEGELDAAFDGAEEAIWNLASDSGLTGILSGGVVAESSPAALSVVVGGPALAYDKDGKRLNTTADVDVDCSVDENGVATTVATPGNERWITVFALFDRVLSDERVDGLGQVIYFSRAEGVSIVVRQGAEAGSGLATKPAVDVSGLILCDILLVNAQTQILNADINTARRESLVVYDASLIGVDDSGFLVLTGVDVQSVLDGVDVEIEDLISRLNLHVAGGAERHDADQIDVDGAGHTYFVGADVQAVLDEADVGLAGAYELLDESIGFALLSGAAPTDGGGLDLNVASAVWLYNSSVDTVAAQVVALNDNDEQWVYFSGGSTYTSHSSTLPSEGRAVARVTTLAGSITEIVDLRLPLEHNNKRRTIYVGAAQGAHFATLSGAVAALDAYRGAGLSTSIWAWDIQVVGVTSEPAADLPIKPTTSGWRIRGSALGRVVFDSETALFEFDAIDDIAVEDLEIRHNAIAAPSGVTRQRVIADVHTVCKDIRFSRIKIYSGGSYSGTGIHGAFLFSNPGDAVCVEDLVIEDCIDLASRDFFAMVEPGGPAYDGISRGVIRNCYARPSLASAGTSPSAAVYLGSGEHVKVVGCDFDNWDVYGIYIDNCIDIKVSECSIESDNECVLVSTNPTRCSVNRCFLSSALSDAIDVSSGRHIITENIVLFAGALGIDELAGVQYNIFANNQANGYGLTIQAGSTNDNNRDDA